jgi:RHS repeat-associated protein
VIAVVTRASQDTRTAYLHVDHLGSTDVITDGTGSALGTVLERRSYDAFGAKRNPAWGAAGPGPWAAKTTVGFTGHESEEDFGLVNMKGRIYDPRVGRFLTTDPLVSHPGFSQSWNPYSYVLNNPLKYVDPSGFDAAPGMVTYGDGQPNPSIPLPVDVVTPEPGAVEASKLVHEINHDMPATPEAPAAWEGDADMPLGGSTETGGSFRENGVVQVEGGFLSGVALGIVPGAGVAAELATAAGVLDEGTRSARVGRSVGEIFGGVVGVVLGATGEVGGGLLTAGGISAVVGIPVIAVSTTFVTGGAANVGVGVRGLAQALMSSGSGAAAPASQFPRGSLRGVSTKWLQRNKPSGWRQVPSDNGQGWKWLDENGIERLRFTRPNGSNPSASQWSRQANGYFRWQNGAGEFLDINGSVVSKSNPLFSELTHILYEGL